MGKLVYRGCEIKIYIKTLMDPYQRLYFSILDNEREIRSGYFKPDCTIKDVFDKLRYSIDFHRYDQNNFDDVVEEYHEKYNYCPYCVEKLEANNE